MLYLASKSPRRRELLDQIGVTYETLSVDMDETWQGDPARIHVPELALKKARAAREQLGEVNDKPILAADTEVFLDDQPLGKPTDEDEALAMLMRLSGRTHDVYCAVVLLTHIESVELSLSRVSFRPLTETECRAFIASGESLDKAGGYGIQGRAAAFINRLEGSYSAVMGLPLFETARLLEQAGIDVLSNHIDRE
ncbi:septum formation protein [Methylohalomonas lacus]|uniref:dTTP/UTP pyrophosphatase n=1 Tax=Methylohalomonas lacus TaxID=398773 RepID=A0AAE3L5T0_9GAMM|nr:Maf family protein [Methylohalomonas lacus]MCS3903957.1 septum formation protein [Methylohalomonas lacus]